MTDLVYEAAVYSRLVKYRNFQGEEKSVTLYFALDPLKLMALIASFEIKTSKSGNPALRGKPEQVSDERKIQFIRDLATKAAGTPSEDGEVWHPFEGFEDSIAGKAFLTKLASSDGDRREFAEKVVMDPFRAFANFAKADPTNTQADVQQFDVMVKQLENIFVEPAEKEETLEEKRARLKAEMDALAADVPVVPGATNADVPII